MGRLVLDENQEPIYAMQLSGVHIGKAIKIGSKPFQKLNDVRHTQDGTVITNGFARTSHDWSGWTTGFDYSRHSTIVKFYKEEETRAKH